MDAAMVAVTAMAMMAVAVMAVVTMMMAPMTVVSVVRMAEAFVIRQARAIAQPAVTIGRRVKVSVTVAAVVKAMAGLGLARGANSCRGQRGNERKRQQRALQHLNLLGRA
jgi:hypothetical protein